MECAGARVCAQVRAGARVRQTCVHIAENPTISQKITVTSSCHRASTPASGGASPVPAQMREGGAQSRCGCASADAQSWRRFGPCADVRRGEPSSSAHLGGVSPDPGADVDAMRESPGAGALSRCAYGVGAACAPCRERCWDPPRGARPLSSDSASACASRCDRTAIPRHAMPSHTRTHAHAQAENARATRAHSHE
jgi:hypothetical protein